MKIEHSRSRKILLPSKGETVAIAAKEKTAALCYDRILIPNGFVIVRDVPDSIRCCGESLIETNSLKLLEWSEKVEGIKNGNIDINEARPFLENMLQVAHDFYSAILLNSSTLDKVNIDTIKNYHKELKANPNLFASYLVRAVAISFSKKYGIPVSIVCGSGKERDGLYKEGDREVVATVLSNLEIVDEKKLTWQQVMEFRKDKISLQKYRRLLHWLDREMIGKSHKFIEDDIAQKLEDYESSLKKHGINTVLGTIEEVLDGKYLLGTSGVVGSFSLAGYPELGVLAGTGLMVGKIAIKLGKTCLDFDDAERGANSEISWVYEVKEQLKK